MREDEAKIRELMVKVTDNTDLQSIMLVEIAAQLCRLNNNLQDMFGRSFDDSAV